MRPWSSKALDCNAVGAACRMAAVRQPCCAKVAGWQLGRTAFISTELRCASAQGVTWLLMLLQAKWDAFDPATADGFAGWLPGFYDAVEAAADTESRWLQGVLPAQVIAGSTFTPLSAWSQMLALCGTAAGMMGRGAVNFT